MVRLLFLSSNYHLTQIRIRKCDGSTDDSAAICYGWFRALSHIVLIRQATDKGTLTCLY